MIVLTHIYILILIGSYSIMQNLRVIKIINHSGCFQSYPLFNPFPLPLFPFLHIGVVAVNNSLGHLKIESCISSFTFCFQQNVDSFIDQKEALDRRKKQMLFKKWSERVYSPVKVSKIHII